MIVGVNVLRMAVLGPSIVWLASCVSQPPATPKEAPREVVVAPVTESITSAELDELTRAFADRYIGLLYSACDTVNKDNPDAVQRREAQALLADCATNIYDIASNADAFTRLLDLVVVTRLMSQVWVDDGRAELVFGNRAKPIVDAMVHARKEAQEVAAQVLTAEQLGVLESLMVDWRKENPEMVRASYVRFSNFAVGRGRSAASTVLKARGMFAEVGQAGQAVDEVRLLGERMFYQLKREPTLLRWQAAAAKDELLATPEVASALADVHRLTGQLEQLPAHVAAEREAIVEAFSARMAGADATISKMMEVVANTQALVLSLDPASKSLDQLLKTWTAVFAQYDAWDRWTFEHDPKPFDIREYTEMVKQSAATSQRLTEMVQSSNDLLTSPDWHARIDEWNRSADDRIEVMAAQSRLLMNGFFWRLYVILGVLIALLVSYGIACLLLLRRSIGRGATPDSPPPSQALNRAAG